VSKPKALDLFCGAGGASRGLYLAGFDVVGVDLRPQPHYPAVHTVLYAVHFEFRQGDALTVDLEGFDFVWSSPPCQAHPSLRKMPNARHHIDLIPATRAKLKTWGGPWVIENVPGSPLYGAVTLCGTMFHLGCQDAELRRHRLFESNVPLLVPECQHGRRGAVIGVYGEHLRNRQRTMGERGDKNFSVEEGREAMGIGWMSLAELSQAIPPRYSEFIGRQVVTLLRCRGHENRR
jgi:DNA (cytosine-5)-methyltransferase 1